MEVNNKVAIVTGGASGLGKATVEALIEKGAKVAIFDLNEEAASTMVNALGQDNCAFFNVNVADEAVVQQAIDDVVNKWGALHIVCNYAGYGIIQKTYSKSGPHLLKDFQGVINVNLVGTFNMCRLAAEKMAANEPLDADGQRGILINTASVAAYEGQIGQVAYAASKGGVVGMTLPMARELSSYGIRVNTIVPGIVHTPPFETVPKELYNALENSVVFPKRLARTSEIGHLACYLIENDYMNGECVRMDGAIRMQPK